MVLDAISLLLGQEQLPTPPRLYDALLNRKYRGQGQVQHFFRKGGRIEFALDFLLYHVEEIALLDILDPGSPYLSSMSRTLSESRSPRLSSNPHHFTSSLRSYIFFDIGTYMTQFALIRRTQLG